MTDALSLLRACRDNPGDFTIYLIAADFFAASDEGDAPDLERALRWMASHQKYPHEVANAVKPGDPPLTSARCWIWARHFRTPPSGSRTTVPRRGMPAHCKLPIAICRVMGMPDHCRYHAWTAALFDLAAALAKMTSQP